MTELHKHPEPLQTAETRHELYRGLPAVFSVNTYWGSGKLTHLGTAEKIPLCGSKLQGADLTDTEVKIEKNGEVWEMLVYDAAERCGFDADDIHPILLDNLDCDFDEE